MRKELDELLCKKYPEIFVDRHADMRKTAMCWGIECGDGWFNIIDKLCGLIQNTVNWSRQQTAFIQKTMKEFDALEKPIPEWMSKHVEIPQVVAVQVKEKYGGLRFYTNGHTDEINGMIDMAEAMSYVTCETCGAPGKVRKGGWIVTLCDKHAEEEGKE